MNKAGLKLLIQCGALMLAFGHLASMVSAQTAIAEDAFAKQQRELSAKNPDHFTFKLKLRDDKTQFHRGEKIHLELSFASSSPNSYFIDNAGYDRSGRLSMDTFVIDRPDGATDPLYDYYHKSIGGFMMGGLRGNPALGPKPEKIDYDLNEWLRFEKPGKYRLYVVSPRVNGGKPYHAGSKPLVAVSNIIEFEILAADRNWEETTLNSAKALLNNPPKPDYYRAESERRAACRTLRFLGTDAAVKEIIERFRGQDEECDFDYYLGVIGAPNPTTAIELMESALEAPAHPVAHSFLSALIFLDYIRQHPEAYIEFGADEAGQKAARAQWATRKANFDLIRNDCVARLANAIAQKRGAAAAISIETLLSYQQGDQSKDAAARRQQMAVALAKVFLDLPIASQRNLLEYNWAQIADPAMLPPLRQLYANPPDAHEIPQPFPEVALARIYELSPVEGRQLILDEIKRPVPRVGIEVLGSLPDKDLPELDEAIVQHLIDFKNNYGHEQDTSAVSHSQETAAALLARYVSPAALPRVRDAFADKLPPEFGCSDTASLLEYFLRTDQSFGLQMIRKLMTETKGLECYARALENAAVKDGQLVPEAQSLVLEYLNDSEPQVVFDAVEVLSTYGSSDDRPKTKAAIQQVIEQLRLKKKDPESNMSRDNPVQVGGFAEALLSKYVHAVPWMVDATEIGELANLCMNDQCRSQAKQWAAPHRPEITIYRPSGLRTETKFSVGLYEVLPWDSLKRKLIQFPKGTNFTWRLDGRENDSDRKRFDELQSYLHEHGLEITRPVKD